MKATKLPSGSWRAQAYDKNTKKRRSFTADTKKEAERQANLWLLTHKESRSVTFGAALDSYIEAREKTRSVTTVREYKRYREKYYGCRFILMMSMSGSLINWRQMTAFLSETRQ